MIRRLFLWLPAAILLIVLVLYPIVATLSLSFITPSGVGLNNYQSVLGSHDTFNSACLEQGPPCGTLVNNLLWTLLHLPLTLFLGLFLAILLQNVRGASIIKSLIFLGMVTPLIVIGVVLRFILEAPIGIVPAFFGFLGIPSLDVSWITSPTTLLFGLIMGTVWSWTGFSMIVYSAGLTTIPKDYFEAARVDGAGPVAIFRFITIPLLMRFIQFAFILTLITSFTALFSLIFVMTTGGPGYGTTTLEVLVYQKAFKQGVFGYAAAMGIVLAVIVFAISIVQQRLLRSRED